MAKLISWNVNGLRACMGKGFEDFFKKADADIICIQESKLQDGQIQLELDGYFQFWNHALKKGYSGTAIFSRIKPLAVSYGIGMDEHDGEGRVITLELDEYYVVTVYTPNAQRGLERLGYRMTWEDAFRSYIKFLDQKKPVIFCGDMNVAHKEIDLEKTPLQIRTTPALQSKSGQNSPSCSKPDLSIPIAISTPIKRTRIPGGHICSMPEKRMSAGVSTISACPKG